MLALGFFLVALLYATVGFGGGSSYLALMAVSGISFELMPKLGLVCNLLVVSGGCWHYHIKSHFNPRLILPFVATSVPMAFLGGMYPVSEKTFLMLLSGSLVLAGLRLLFVSKVTDGPSTRPSVIVSLLVGAGLGFLSGIVALGGGIFLSPLLQNLKWAKPKEAAATASAFIFLNSVAGLFGQLTKGVPPGMGEFWPLFIAVIIGGQIGSRIGTHPKMSQGMIQRGTALLILFIAGRLLLKQISLL